MTSWKKRFSVEILLTVLLVWTIGSCEECSKEQYAEIRKYIEEYRRQDTVSTSVMTRINGLQHLFNDIKKSDFLDPIDQIKTLRESLNALNETLSGQNSILKYHHISEQGASSAWSTINETVSRQEAKFGELEPQLAILENQVQNQTEQLTQYNEDWNELKNLTTDIESKLAYFDSSFRDLETLVRNQENTVERTNQRADQAEVAMNTTITDNEWLTSYLSNFTDAQYELESRITALAVAIDDLKSATPNTDLDASNICAKFMDPRK